MLKKGFTLIEALVVLALIGIAIAITVTTINIKPFMVEGIHGKIISDLDSITSACITYKNNNHEYPSTLNDPLFAPAYIMPPVAPSEFDQSYGYQGYFLGSVEDGGTNENGTYLCVRAKISGTQDVRYQALQKMKNRYSKMKFFISNTCPATNDDLPSYDNIVYGTMWIERH